MLSLRLSKGLNLTALKEKYSDAPIEKIIKKASFLKEKGLINFDGNTISLTENGFLLSNNIITELMYN